MDGALPPTLVCVAFWYDNGSAFPSYTLELHAHLAHFMQKIISRVYSYGSLDVQSLIADLEPWRLALLLAGDGKS